MFVGTTLTCLSVNLAGNLLLIPRYGWRAAAALTIVTELVLFLQNAFWIRRTVGKISLPTGVARTSLTFGTAVALALLGARMGLPLEVGTTCLVCFVAYLYCSGAAAEFAAVWGLARSTSA